MLINDQVTSAKVTRSQPNPVAVLVIEPRQWMRDCVCSSLARNSDFISVGIARLGDAGGMVGQHENCPVVLLCVFADHEFSESYSDIQSACLSMPVIVLYEAVSGYIIEKLLGLGIRGFIPAALGWDTVAQAIRLISSGGTIILKRSVVAAEHSTPQVQGNGFALTARQSQVANCVKAGKSNKVIAYELRIQESTVKLHVKAIMRKLQARNRTEAALRYFCSIDRPAAEPYVSHDVGPAGKASVKPSF